MTGIHLGGARVLALSVVVTTAVLPAPARCEPPRYRDTRLSVQERVDDLLSRMNLDEKIHQLSMKSLSDLELDDTGAVTTDSLVALFGQDGIGFVESPFVEHGKVATLSAAADAYLREKTPLGIPAIQTAECLHGVMALGATIFPQAIGQGSTWNPALISRMAEAIAREAILDGTDQALSPLFDLARDPRWGRVEECFGEDPYLVSRMGVAFVTAMQGNAGTFQGYSRGAVMCTAKHFVAYGVPQAGLNLAPAVVGERELRTLHLPPFAAAVQEARVASVMPGYHDVDGVPLHVNRWLLDDVLRGELGFRGVVFSDYEAIRMLEDFQLVSDTPSESAYQALTAGVDVEAPKPHAYPELKHLVESGRLSEDQLDRAVGRVLTAKLAAGLLERPFVVDPGRADKIHTPEDVALAREVAEESIVLLQNRGGLLPLDGEKLRSIAVIGPNANQVQFGDYSVTKSNRYGVTVLEGIQELVGPQVRVLHARGCGITDLDKSGFGEAVAAAEKSDVVIVVIGGTSIIYSGIGWGNEELDVHNTSGEGLDRTTLDPPGVQSQLIRALHATGKPLVLVMVHGRPYSIPWETQHVPAIVEAWYPGEQGGLAVARVLFGLVNPSGKLPVTVPSSPGHLPQVVDRKRSNRGYYGQPGRPDSPGRDYVFSSPDPLFPFGHGLSYTTFEYSNLRVDRRELGRQDTLGVSVEVTNTGGVAGQEVVQVYVNDKVSSVTTPLRQLRRFQKTRLKPGQTKTHHFRIPVQELGLWDREMRYLVEPGEFEILVGSSSVDIRLQDTVLVQ